MRLPGCMDGQSLRLVLLEVLSQRFVVGSSCALLWGHPTRQRDVRPTQTLGGTTKPCLPRPLSDRRLPRSGRNSGAPQGSILGLPQRKPCMGDKKLSHLIRAPSLFHVFLWTSSFPEALGAMRVQKGTCSSGRDNKKLGRRG